ncbi:MAG: beta-lactamase family protein [Rhizobiaceae bacterium]|nr:beta-lactamase family protein [Rhizobiaceae bacterium]MCV0405455.1 beta-lactamase family protein [Rhizobiaceae bacterium]
MNRRSLLALPLVAAFPATLRAQDYSPDLSTVIDEAGRLDPLKAVMVARGGEVLAERGYRGHRVDGSTNIKSASKAVISALVGIAIERGVLDGVDQTIAPILKADLPADPDPRIHDITIGHLLSMRAGLGRTSGPNYGRWVSSRNWVRAALAMPFDDEPGGRMLYSTGSTHLLSAILTRLTGRTTLELARDWLEPVEDFRITAWERDPQGIYLGGNQMAMSTRSLAAFGRLYRDGGRAGGEQVVPEAWIAESWTPRTRSVWSGDGYGYGWFLREIGGHDMRYAWGYGGQMLYIAPALDLVIAMTSEENNPSARTGYRDALHRLAGAIAQAVETV